MSFIYDLFTIVWLFTILYYRSFSISFTFLISFLASIKSISLIMGASYLTTQGYQGYVSKVQYIFTHLITFIRVLFLTLSISLGSDGYGIFYEIISFRRIYERIIIPIGLSVTYTLFSIFDITVSLPFLLFPTIIFIFLYLEQIFKSQIVTLDLLMSVEDEITIKKCTLAYNLSLSSLVLIFIWLSFQSFSVLTQMPHSSNVFISELIEFSLYVFMGFNFVFRDMFKGEFQKREEIEVYNLDDPMTQDIIFTESQSC